MTTVTPRQNADVAARSKSGKTQSAVRETEPAMESADVASEQSAPASWCFVLSLIGGVLLWLAFPPIGWSILAWAAPVFWLLLVVDHRRLSRRGYLLIWITATLHWLALLEGIRLAHPALYAGWFALSAYIAVYIALFVGLTRVAIHRLRMPLVIAAPAIWTGLELLRGHAFTGFSMALLGHTQADWLTLIQISDLVGAYGVSFVIVFVAACVTHMLDATNGRTQWQSKHRFFTRFWPVAAAAAMLGAALAYGVIRAKPKVAADETNVKSLRVAVIQGSFDTFFEYDPAALERQFRRHEELSHRAIADHPDVELIIWPESMFSGRLSEVLANDEIGVPDNVGVSEEEYRHLVRQVAEQFRMKARDMAVVLNRTSVENGGRGRVHLLVGCDTQVPAPAAMERYNSVLMIDPDGDITARYFKMHAVMFGEYIPFGDAIPWLYSITPMPGGMSVGQSPQSFAVGDVRVSPSVCFESTVPHLIRGHVRQLDAADSSPDALVNVTNDGWFKGSSVLDLHLVCGVFRAVENRRPILIAANTGLSAIIDARGAVIEKGPRRDEGILFAEVDLNRLASPYVRWGDWFGYACLALCVVAAIAGFGRPRRLFERIAPTARK